MSIYTAALLGGIAGVTIFIGLPVARLRGLPKRLQGFLNAVATGILVFLLWDILQHAGAPVSIAVRGHDAGRFVLLAGVFAAGIAAGLLSLVYFNSEILGRLKGSSPGSPSPQALSMMIATGLGLHNFSEGLAIGQSAATGAVAFAGVLVVGFALHNITEGFGIAAPMTMNSVTASWGFLGLAGLIGGGPTLVGTLIGYVATNAVVSVLFLALAAGALLYVLNELFALGKRLNTPAMMGWGVLAGFLAAFATDLVLTAATG